MRKAKEKKKEGDFFNQFLVGFTPPLLSVFALRKVLSEVVVVELQGRECGQ